ncbi:RidA family protein [Actinokineospora soli]|uniref:RidA family protein n=1 Tax=Actinokineospora soli TaxID=1048753 RepID=A0ABW2TJ50_9PSEU
MLTLHNPPTTPAPFADRYANLAEIDLGAARLLVLSGQVALDHDGAVVGPGDMTAQATAIFTAVEALLADRGAGFADVVNVRTYLTDLSLLAEYAAVRRRFFTGPPPTSTTVEVSRLFLPDALLEVEITAVV